MSESVNEMVIRCEKTGKLFFDEKSAKLHSEETGYSDFAQVSLEEKVWECVETGKICFNQTQMDLHKRRVPEAVTWNEKTVADLRTATKAKESEGAADMETEEDLLLRQAGKAPKGKGKAKEAGPPVVTKEVLAQLVDMGFSELRAQKALVKTSNAGVENAINWLTEHLEDADIDDPIEGEIAVKTSEELGQAAAEALAGGGSQLTAEEKKAKLDDALAKARAKKAGVSVEEQKQAERARREGGQANVQSKRDLEDAQRKRDLEARKREKREFEEERKKLREKLEADRQEKIKNGLLKPAAPKPQPAAAPAPAPAPAPKKPKSEAEREAEQAMLAAAGGKRSYDEDLISLEEAQQKICALLDTQSKPAIEMLTKMVANIAKAPAEEKYRKVRLSNPKIAETLVHVAGARQFLRALGWQLVETEFLQLPVDGDGSAQAAVQSAAVTQLTSSVVAATEARRVAELEARKKEAADKAAKAKREREEMKAAMARDRAEVASRGPAQASIAKKLPTESGGTMTSAIFSEQEEAEARRDAQ